MEASGHVDRGAIGQRHHGTDTGSRHQAPAHLIVPHDGEQAAVQDAELLAKRPSDNEQWFDQSGYICKIRDQLSDACLEPDLAHYTHLEAEVAQGATQIIVDSDGLIPSPIDQNPWAHWRNPMDMMRQGWSTSLFQ